jgi:hypothetical protein
MITIPMMIIQMIIIVILMKLQDLKKEIFIQLNQVN